MAQLPSAFSTPELFPAMAAASFSGARLGLFGELVFSALGLAICFITCPGELLARVFSALATRSFFSTGLAHSTCPDSLFVDARRATDLFSTAAFLIFSPAARPLFPTAASLPQIVFSTDGLGQVRFNLVNDGTLN